MRRRCACAGAAMTATATSANTIRSPSPLTRRSRSRAGTLIGKAAGKRKRNRRTEADRDGPFSGRDAGTAGVAVARFHFECRAAAGAVAERCGQAATAFRTEDRVGFGARAVGGTGGMRDARCEMRSSAARNRRRIPHLASRIPRLGPQRRERLRRVLAVQPVVIRVGELTGGAIALDLPERAQGDGAWAQIVVRILAVLNPSRVPRPPSLDRRPEYRLQDEPHRRGGEQHADDELDHGTATLGTARARAATARAPRATRRAGRAAPR